MVDQKLRHELSQDLRWLVTGRMTTDDFDDVYLDRYSQSVDRGAAQIAAFGYGLYSSGLLWPYRLRGRHAVDRITRRMAARCVLFLCSSREYDWPEMPRATVASLLWGLLVSLGIPCGIAILICTIPPLAMGLKEVEFLWPLAIVGAAFLVGGIWSFVGHRAFMSTQHRVWQASGDFDVWPFWRREEFYLTRRGKSLQDGR